MGVLTENPLQNQKAGGLLSHLGGISAAGEGGVFPLSQKKTSPVTNPDQDMQVLADNLWSYFEPKIKSLLSSGVSYYRAQVTQAASGGTITVQRPFDQTQLALPYVSSAEGLEVGRQVTVLVLGSQSNAIVLGNGTLSNL